MFFLIHIVSYFHPRLYSVICLLFVLLHFHKSFICNSLFFILLLFLFSPCWSVGITRFCVLAKHLCGPGFTSALVQVYSSSFITLNFTSVSIFHLVLSLSFPVCLHNMHFYFLLTFVFMYSCFPTCIVSFGDLCIIVERVPLFISELGDCCYWSILERPVVLLVILYP